MDQLWVLFRTRAWSVLVLRIPKIPSLNRKRGYLISSGSHPEPEPAYCQPSASPKFPPWPGWEDTGSAGSALGPIQHQSLDCACPHHSQNSLPGQERRMLRSSSGSSPAPFSAPKPSGSTAGEARKAQKTWDCRHPPIPGSRARLPPRSIPLSRPFLPRGSGVLPAAAPRG